MDSHEKRLKDFLNKSDKALLMEIEKGWDKTPDSDLAKTILQNRLKEEILELEKTIKKNNEQTKWHNGIMITLMIIMLLLTGVLIYYAQIQVWPIREQWKINMNQVRRDCENDPTRTITFDNGSVLECSEFLEENN